MKKNIPKNLIQHFLKNSPRKVAETSTKMMPYLPLNVKHTPTDAVVVDQFLFRISCDYLHNEQYYFGKMKPSQLPLHIQSQKSGMNQIPRNSSKNILESYLIESIKNLNENKDKPTVFLEAIEIVETMTSEEGQKHKKYLVYLYKWSINQSQKVPQITSGLNQELKKTVVNKIYEGHQRKQDLEGVKEQLKRIQTLAKAREGIAKGDSNAAKTNYEVIFNDDKNDPNTRMEALEYLCRQSVEKGDEGYLLGIMTRIPESTKEEHHKKYIQKTIEKIHKSNTSKTNTQTLSKE